MCISFSLVSFYLCFSVRVAATPKILLRKSELETGLLFLSRFLQTKNLQNNKHSKKQCKRKYCTLHCRVFTTKRVYNCSQYEEYVRK